ncbi:MAG: hypothetical protein J6W51_11510 [Fibrobacter sp.]|nr:hypothetical protein [Fibrobacter sp.]
MMKLTSAKLISKLKRRLQSMGFTYFKETGVTGSFKMKVNSNLYLTLSLTIDRWNDSMFTGEYSLSLTTRWGYTIGDIPRDSYKRISYVLSDEERARYSKEENPNVKDLWWNGMDEADVNSFLEIVELTYKRFSSDSDLVKRILQSNDAKMLAKLSQETIDCVNKGNFAQDLECQPNKEIDFIPFEWFKAAETVLKQNGSTLHEANVIQLASDAYRRSVLDGCVEMKRGKTSSVSKAFADNVVVKKSISSEEKQKIEDAARRKIGKRYGFKQSSWSNWMIKDGYFFYASHVDFGKVSFYVKPCYYDDLIWNDVKRENWNCPDSYRAIASYAPAFLLSKRDIPLIKNNDFTMENCEMVWNKVFKEAQEQMETFLLKNPDVESFTLENNDSVGLSENVDLARMLEMLYRKRYEDALALACSLIEKGENGGKTWVYGDSTKSLYDYVVDCCRSHLAHA